MNIEINNDILKEKKIFDSFFKDLLNNHLSNSYLEKVMLYSTLYGGKRIRPYLVKQFAKIKKVNFLNYSRLAATIEIIHSYSLIHDDLPSMDDDDFRRGKPSTHKKFTEAQAILAGDSLHDLAFEILANIKTCPNSKNGIKLINYLSKSIGSLGLAGGQSLDLLYEKKFVPINKIIEMYNMKTGALFEFCCIGPFIIANATKNEVAFASRYGIFFGLIFQIIDDYLDISGNKYLIGKTPGKDLKQKKSTILKYLKFKDTNKFCKKTTENFIDNNKYYLKKWPKLHELLYHLVDQLN